MILDIRERLEIGKFGFGKIGRTASEEVVLELVKSKCLPILLYGLECFSLTVSDMKALEFTVTRFLMKLFKSSNINLINDSRYYFNFELPNELQMKRKDKFIEKFMASRSEASGLFCHSVTALS